MKDSIMRGPILGAFSKTYIAAATYDIPANLMSEYLAITVTI